MTEFPETQSVLLANLQSPENQEAWEAFVLLYRPVIYRMARRRGFQDSDAQDLAQGVLLRVSRSIGSWTPRPGVRFRHWLRKVAYNAILTAMKEASRGRLVGGSGLELMAAAYADEDGVQQELERECLRERLQQAAVIVRSDVSPETWAAFELTAIGGLSCEEAAAQLGKSIGTVYASRSRVLKLLQREVERYEGGS